MYKSSPFVFQPHGKRMHNFNPLDSSPPLREHIRNSNFHAGVDPNPVKIHNEPAAHKALMYGWGHGIQPHHNAEPPIKNTRSTYEVNLLDYSNYFKAPK